MMNPYSGPYRIIAFGVIGVHAVMIGSLLWWSPVEQKPEKTKKLIVQTVELKAKSRVLEKELAMVEMKQVPKPVEQVAPPPKIEPEPESPPKQPQKVEAKPIPKSAPKALPKPVPLPKPKVAPKPTKKEPQKVTPATKVEPPAKNIPSKASLDAIKQKLAAIPSLSTLVATKGDGKEGDVTHAAFEYEEELIARLKILLKLPEMGDVKVTLTLNRQGKVVKTEIISAANLMNRKAIEAQLPTIQFPPFGKTFVGENTHTFTITLTNL